MGTHVNLIDSHDRSLSEVMYGEAPPITIYDLNSTDSRVRDLFFKQLEDNIVDLCSHYSQTFPQTADNWDPNPVQIDEETRLRKLTQQALEGDSSSMMGLAKHYHETQNLADAQIWYQQALKKEHPEASVGLGRLYLDMEDDESATRLFLAESHNPQALCELGKLYFKSKEYTTAFKYTLRAAAYQNIKAINLLAILQVLGLGTEKNEYEAQKNFLRALKEGDQKAMNNYALMLYLGRGGEVDLSNAFTFFNEAAGLGIAAGYYHLGLMYEKGIGVEKHEATAKDCYLAASKIGSPIAMTRIGCWYRDHNNLEKAIYWWEQAAYENDLTASHELWNHFKTKDLERGLKYLNLAKQLDPKKGLALEDGCLYHIE